LQNLLKVTKCHGLKPRSTAGKERHESRIPSTETSKTPRVKSIYICNDSTGAEVQEGAEEHIQISKPSYIITTSHYRVPTVVRSTSQVQQSRPPEESTPAGALINVLPRIDQIIDSTAGCARLSFLDAYSGYNQIKLKKEDEEKIAFITPYGVFCYQVMPFGLKNAGATYQRMMQNCLGSQIGRNIQVYIDDVVITTWKEESLISDLAETFNNLNRYKLKLNPTKCSFGVSAG
jgi:hypothetical protein